MESYDKLKKDFKENNLLNLYIFTGEEDYLKNFYLKKIEDLLLSQDFKDFNLEKFDETNFDVDDFYNAVESYPSMSDKKLIILRDIDIFKQKSDVRDKLQDIFSDIPDYTYIIFDYATIEYKPDNRLKLGKTLKTKAEVVEFKYLANKELFTWITKKFSVFNIKINAKVLDYFVFICSKSMTNLSSEIEKLSVYSKEEVTEKDIDDICTKVLEAKIFDITDKLIKKDINGANALIDDLLMLNVDEFSIISVINSQFQRLYSAKLGSNQKVSEKFLMELWGIFNGYAVKMTLNQAKTLDLYKLKLVCNSCVKTSMDMVSVNAEKRELIDDLVLKIGYLL